MAIQRSFIVWILNIWEQADKECMLLPSDMC